MSNSLQLGTDVRYNNTPINMERRGEGVLPIDGPTFVSPNKSPISTQGLNTIPVAQPLSIAEANKGNVLVTATTEDLPIKEEKEESQEFLQCNVIPKMSDEDMMQNLFNILTSKGPGIGCAFDTWDFYPITNPFEGDYKWQSGAEVFYRHSENDNWMKSTEYTLKYSRWKPKETESNKNPQKLLLLHDALDSRKGWWCTQKLLSPFFDTISVDLLGSGESMKPRGLSNGQKFPWLYKAHALYLNDMVNAVWPGENFYVAGVGWGAQIAACMASMNNKVTGFIMINPPGFIENNHPEAHYLDFYHLRNIQSDEKFDQLEVCMTSRARDILVLGLSSNDIGYSGRDNVTSSNIKLLLEQYMDLDRQRVMIDQIVYMAENKLQEFPKIKGNPNGLEISTIKAPCLIISGGNDIFYPPEHRNLYSLVYYNSVVETSFFPEIGHFAHIENPRIIAECILDFIREKSGPTSLIRPFIGFIGGSQGNEQSIMKAMHRFYKF